MLNAIVLAGDQGDVFNKKVTSKALLKISGKYMIEYVIDSLKELDYIDKIAVVGDKNKFTKILSDSVDYILNSTNSLTQNILIGLNAVGYDKKVLLLTSDIPMITSEALDDFVTRSIETGADICYPIIRKEVNDFKYPGNTRTYTKMKDGTFTGGNVFFINPAVIDRCIFFAEKFIKYRKKPWQLSRLLSWKFTAQLLMGKLTIKKVEDRFSKILGIKAKAIISNYPEIGNDVDKESDLELAQVHLK